MTIFKPSTCFCIIEFPIPFNERNAIQKQKCRSHDTAAECLQHNRRFSNIPDEAIIEKRKPEFQRR